MRIHIETTPYKAMRYPTVGDWQITPTGIFIQVSDMGNEDYAFLVGIHEAIEVWLCQKHGVTTEEVDAFDKDFEAKREEGNIDEPGDSKLSPYYCEHQFASNIECMIAYELGVDLTEYEEAVNALSQKSE